MVAVGRSDIFLFPLLQVDSTMLSCSMHGVHRCARVEVPGGGIKFRFLHTESTLLNTDLEILEEGGHKSRPPGGGTPLTPPLHTYD